MHEAYRRNTINIFLKNIQESVKKFVLNEKSVFPFVIIILMTILLLYNNSMIVNSQKNAYDSNKIANELRNSSEDLTKNVRTFVVTGEPKYEKAYWHILNVRNGKEPRPDGEKIPLNLLMKQLGFTNKELADLKKSQDNSDKLVKKEVIAMNAVKGIYDINVLKLNKPGESKKDFAIRILNDESYHKDKAAIMKPIYDVIEFVDKRTRIKITQHELLNYIYMIVTFFIVFLLFIRFMFLINEVKKNVERERLLRKIVATMHSSLEINTIKNIIVAQVGKALSAERCCLLTYNEKTDDFNINEHSEYRLSEKVKSLININLKEQNIEWLTNLYKNKKEVIINNIKTFNIENHSQNLSIKQYFQNYNIKASYDIPLFNSDEMIGILSVQYTRDYVKLDPEDIEFIRIIAIQAAEAIFQAELYQKVQLQAERERINRTIVEILRSSMDKAIIKKLFVKNIGKFFGADRVFFSDYDSAAKMYLPADSNSEYLSNNNQKSFVGFDWSDSDMNEHIQPLLEKKEIKINNLDEYIKENPDLNKELTARYIDFDVKSSYNFPVLHENDILGYFCIEFTNNVYRLSDEDLTRIRSICTQAGIALYHAELYSEAQQCISLRESSISEISEQIIKPASEILDFSTLLAKNEFERQAQIEYLNNIIYSCNHLLELTKNYQ